MANVEPGAGIPVTSFYLCHRTSSTRLQATTDALFEELDNGNLSDVDGEFDESDDESVVPCAPDEHPVESDTESSDDECTEHIWRLETKFIQGARLNLQRRCPRSIGTQRDAVPLRIFQRLCAK
ncbi:hypothetical protein MRX96_050151 [Rhipicephalus microplus]